VARRSSRRICGPGLRRLSCFLRRDVWVARIHELLVARHRPSIDLLHDQVTGPAQLHRHPTGPNRGETSPHRPSGRHQPHRTVGKEPKGSRPLSPRVLNPPRNSGHRPTPGIPPLLARLLRCLLRRSDQRHPLGTGASAENSLPPPELEVVSSPPQNRVDPPGLATFRSPACPPGCANTAVPLTDRGIPPCPRRRPGPGRQNMVKQFSAVNPALGPDEAAQVVGIAIHDLCPWHG
jgi:hypothetical protein